MKFRTDICAAHGIQSRRIPATGTNGWDAANIYTQVTEIMTAFKITRFILKLQGVLYPPPLSNLIHPPLHQGTGVIERIDNNASPSGVKLYLIQF